MPVGEDLVSDIKQRLSSESVARIVRDKYFGDLVQLLARDALQEIERLERIHLWNEFHLWWDGRTEEGSSTQQLMFEAWVAASKKYAPRSGEDS